MGRFDHGLKTMYLLYLVWCIAPEQRLVHHFTIASFSGASLKLLSD